MARDGEAARDIKAPISEGDPEDPSGQREGEVRLQESTTGGDSKDFERIQCRLREECHLKSTRGHSPDDDPDGQPSQGLEGGRGCHQGEPPPQEEREEGDQVRGHLLYGDRSVSVGPSCQDPRCEKPSSVVLDGMPGWQPPSGPWEALPESKARSLANQADRMLPEAFEALLSHGRTRLLEIACSEDSILTRTMRSMTKSEDSAHRCSLWNGCDLGTNSGIHRIISTIDRLNPEHVWMSPICGPYSVMQNINQRTISQQEDLAEKRRAALKQYVGCSIIYQYCIDRGIHVTWEWSQSCQAWRLPLLQNLVQRFNPFFAVVRGCRVDLKGPSGDYISKGWKLMTTHQLLARRMDLACQCSPKVVHLKCEGSLTKQTELYTPKFAKRVCEAILHGMDRCDVVDTMSGRFPLLELFGNGTVCRCDVGKNHDAMLECGSCVHQSQCKIRKSSGLMEVGAVGTVDSEEDHPLPGLEEVLEDGSDRAQEPQEHRDVAQNPQINREEIRRKLYLLHAATGHGPLRHLLQALRRQGVSQEVMKEAERFECSVCKERRHPAPRPFSTLEPHPPKWSTISCDLGHWDHPVSGAHMQFLMIVDEGSRFRVGRFMNSGTKQHVTAAQFLEVVKEAWAQYFGLPNVLRLDPDGSFRSKAVEEYCDRHQIHLDIIPGEAHWKLGICEQAIQGTQHTLSKLVEDDPELSPQEALSEAIRVFNSRDLVRGYSPIQHALGRAPDATGRLFPQPVGDSPDLVVENGTGEMDRNLQRMLTAEKAFLDWTANERLKKARNSRSRPTRAYQPGDLVYIWRKQVSGQKTSKVGRFIGPARVLATEQHTSPDGHGKTGSSIWCVRGRRLLKCCMEQLRPATDREVVLSELQSKTYDDWTFQKIAKELGGNEYEDITSEVPDLPEWLRAQDPQLEWQPSHRCRSKTSAIGPVPAPATGSSGSGHTRSRSPVPRREQELHEPPTGRARIEPGPGFVASEPWWQASFIQEAFNATECAFWNDEHASIEVAVDMPNTRTQSERALQDLTAYVANHLKKRSAIEVSERHLTAEELQQFRTAKSVEVNNFISARAFEAIPDHLKPSLNQAIKMRWILTWKYRDDGGKKAKARAVLLGYQDPCYEERATHSPTTTRQTRQLQLQLSSSMSFTSRKGDVTGAFLQSRTYPGELYCIPCAEICKAMNIPEESITRVRKACYGLVDAPLEWYRSVCSFFGRLGLRRLWSDPCCWILQKNDVIHGIISGHVDDFIFSGRDEDPIWTAVVKSIKDEYKWSDWEESSFIQCGVKVEQLPDFTYQLSQAKYVDDLKYINLRAHRKKDRKAETDNWEKSQLRAPLGGISWHAQQVAPHVSAEVGLLLSEVNRSTIDTIVRANQLLDLVKSRRDHKLVIHPIPLSEISLYVWVDAASQNRLDGGSTQGLIVGISSKKMLEGACTPVTFISWHSQKIDRVCRSPGAAEAIAASNGEDCLFYARFQLGEMLGYPVDTRNVHYTVRRIEGCVVTDSRNVFDKLECEVLTIRGAEKKTDIELLGLKESQNRNGTRIRWVHSEAQLSNGLTKAREQKQLDLFYQMGQYWRIVEDSERASARKRKQDGLGPLENRSTKDTQPQQQQHTTN